MSKTLTEQEVIDVIGETVLDSQPSDFEKDSEGQLVIHTSIFVWHDGTYHAEKEP